MNEKEARQLLTDQTHRRGNLEQIQRVRAEIRIMLLEHLTPHPIVDSLTKDYLQGADNNLYLAEQTIKAMLEAYE